MVSLCLQQITDLPCTVVVTEADIFLNVNISVCNTVDAYQMPCKLSA